MSMDMTKAMNYSWMSQASYLDLSSVILGSPGSLRDYLQLKALNDDKIFAADQATLFTDPANGFSLISHLPNTPNGTSLTVFSSNADGSYTLAVRGTEPGGQLGTDLLQDIVGVVAVGSGISHVMEALREAA
jgi:hypothetical protein